MRTREDALRVLADHCMLYRPMMWTEYVPSKVKEHIMLARDWNVDGVLYHLDLGCKFMAAGHQEAKMAVQNMGISTMSFEASSSDPRDLSESQVVDQMDAFLSNMGLKPIEAPGSAPAGDGE
jgi:benzoyl-CoA reductase subunit B